MSTVQLKRWSRKDNDRMIDAGIFAPGERVGQHLSAADMVSPLATPQARIAVADLLP